jgi:hypothetical protein
MKTKLTIKLQLELDLEVEIPYNEEELKQDLYWGIQPFVDEAVQEFNGPNITSYDLKVLPILYSR